MAGDLTIGIDLGGTQVRAALVADGRIVRRASARTDVKGGPDAVLRQFKRLMSEVCPAEEWTRLAGVGIAAPGPLDSETGTIIQIPTLPNWESFPLRDILERDLGMLVLVENDGIAAAYGEWQYGAGKGLRHLVYVTVSTGIGGGVVVDGHLMHGRRGMACHVGHFQMAAVGPLCSCGATACFEALASGTALGKRALKVAQDHPASMLGQWLADEAVDASHVAEGARRGDPLCLQLMAEEARYLGAGFTGIIHLYSPELVIIGGGVSQAFDLLERGIQEVIRRDAMGPFKSVPVTTALLGDNSGLVGAAALALATSRKNNT